MVYYDKSSRGFRTNHHSKPYGGNRDRQRGHYNNRNRGYDQGPPKEDTFEHRLSNLILRVGDNISKNLQNNLETLAEILEKDYAKHSDFILDIFEKCISELPHKSSIYGTLVGLLTARNYDLGGSIVNRASTGFSHALETGDWRRAKILLRFFAELVNSNMILSSTLIAIYNNLLSVFNEENPIKDRVDCMVELVLASLPWAARDLSERNPHDFSRMFESIEKYISTRKSLQDPRLQVLTVHQKGYSGVPNDKLELLWIQMLKLKEQNWDAQILPKPYTLFESTLGSALQHDVPEFTPVPHDSSVSYPTPTNVFFCHSEHLTKCQSPAYYIISDVISDLVDLMEHNRRECIKYILSIPSSFPDDTFYTAKEVDPEQEAGEIAVPQSLLSLEKIIIECIFNKVLTLPNPCHKPVYYGVLIVEGIKSSPVAFTYALKNAVPGIYEQVSDLDIGCINRLYNWFSHYLSHIEYKWDFDTFGQVWDLESVDFRRIFVAGTLEKCIRLAYYERIKEAISEPMQALIGDLSPEPSYKYKHIDENTPQGKLKKQIDGFIQSKADINMIKHCINEASANPELTTDIVREIVIETLLVQGSKSFSHMLNVIERHSGVFTFLINSDTAKDHLVQLVVSFWSPVPQWMGIQLDKFTNYNLISSANIINWLFSENAIHHYHRAHVWEILQNTINKLRYWILDIENQIKRLSPDDNMQTDDFDPYAEEISSLQTNLTSARQELKNNIFLVFQGFCSILSKYLAQLDSQGSNHAEDTLFRIMAGRFREFGRDYLEIYSPFMITLENITFTKEVDPRVFSLFSELQSLANPPKFEQPFNFK